MANKKEKKWDQEQELYRSLVRAEPLCLFICVIRETLSEEAKVLEDQLTKAGLTTSEREAVFKELSQRRKQLEADIDKPGAYGRLRAMAETLGLLEAPPASEASGKELSAP